MFVILPVFTSKYDLNLIPSKVSESGLTLNQYGVASP